MKKRGNYGVAVASLLAELILSASVTCQLPNKPQEEQPAQIFTNPRIALKVGKRGPATIAFNPDGSVLAVGADFGNAELSDVSRGTLVKSFPQVPNASHVAFSPDGRTLATGGKTIQLWDVETGQLRATLVESDDLPRIAFSPDGRNIATSTMSRREAHISDVQSGKLEATLIHPKPHDYVHSVENVIYSMDGKTLITSSAETIYLWNVADGKLRSKLIDPNLTWLPTFWNKLKETSHGDSIYTLALSPDGQILASGSRDTTAKLWSVETGELKAILGGHKRWVNKGRIWLLAFSPNGEILATGSDDKTVKLWGTSTGRLRATLLHRGSVRSMSFSPEGKLIVTASDNEKAANVWSARKGELVAKLKNATYPVVFSLNGRTLATGSRDKAVLLWDVPN